MKGSRVFGTDCKSSWKAFRVPFFRLSLMWLLLCLPCLIAVAYRSQGSVEAGQDASAPSIGDIGPAQEHEHVQDAGANLSPLRGRLGHLSTVWPFSSRSSELEGRTNTVLPAEETPAIPSVASEQWPTRFSGLAGADNSRNAVGDASPPQKGEEQKEEGKANKKKTPATNDDENTTEDSFRGSSRVHYNTWKPASETEDAAPTAVYHQPILRLPLPPVRGLKRVVAGLVASSLTGGSLPALALGFWGALDLFMSMAARATLRGLDPSFTTSLKNWLKRDAARKAKEGRKSN